jgi:hypothetical protein
MIAASVPAALAIVWTMLFSRIEEPLKWRRIAMEITAAGIDVAKVSPTFRPRYTLAAVNKRVINPPSRMLRSVSSAIGLVEALMGAAVKAGGEPGQAATFGRCAVWDAPSCGAIRQSVPKHCRAGVPKLLIWRGERDWHAFC